MLELERVVCVRNVDVVCVLKLEMGVYVKPVDSCV